MALVKAQDLKKDMVFINTKETVQACGNILNDRNKVWLVLTKRGNTRRVNYNKGTLISVQDGNS